MQTRTNKTFFIVGLFLLVIELFFALDNYTFLFSSTGDFAEAGQDSTKTSTWEPQVVHGLLVNGLEVKQEEVKKNQLFADLLVNYAVSQRARQELNTLSRSVFDFRRVAAGRKYTLIAQSDSVHTLKALVYEPNAVEYVVFHLEDSLRVEFCNRNVTTLEKSVTGVIESTLSETIEALGASNELTNKFVDIFAWQVDFQRLQRGDQFKLIFEENLVEGKSIGIGKILAIYFEHAGSGYYAFPFDQGNGVDYFDEQGKSLRKALLKYPIEFTSISSRYNLNRFHPVAKVFRPHLGTDFAAPTGTPIRAVGDGTVEEAQFKSNNGNYVKIHHNGTYTTAYLHMSRIAAGMSPGVRVRQGQTIGYVGSTGLATGPHVCYRFWRNGVQVDALRVELPPSQPIRKPYLESFCCVKEELIERLAMIPFADQPEETPLVATR